jgi:ABC-type lipoprotein export system ATPase subunit/bifunctional DNA-binding transcriptional regulator/antitoxin component of YhaV-PrlF toxin-antitoxin module
MSEPIIVCENLVKIFKVAELEVVALQGLDLTVQRGELLGIVGSSGSGKSTLMNVLGGLVRPSAGQVVVNGHDLLKLSDAAQSKYRREEVGFVWQQAARNLIPYLSAIENVTLPMTLAGRERQARARAGELLDLVGLAERRDHRLPQLSGGEQQRVAIAVALANRPSLLLADEPTGELDSTTALSIYEALRALNRELGVTILIVSHDRTIVRHVGRVMAIRDGKTAGETVRRARPAADTTSDTAGDTAHAAPHADEHYEELLVLDSAGRLQIPKAYREALGIGDRVRMEMGENGTLVIHPADGAAVAPVAAVAPNEIVAAEKEAHAKALRGEGAKEEKTGLFLPLRLSFFAPLRERLRDRLRRGQ